MYSQDEWEIASYPNKLLMQISEWLFEYKHADTTDYVRNYLKERMAENFGRLEKIGLSEDSYFKKLKEEMEKL